MSKRVRRTNLLNAMALVNTFLLHFHDSLSQHLELSVSSNKIKCLFLNYCGRGKDVSLFQFYFNHPIFIIEFKGSYGLTVNPVSTFFPKYIIITKSHLSKNLSKRNINGLPQSKNSSLKEWCGVKFFMTGMSFTSIRITKKYIIDPIWWFNDTLFLCYDPLVSDLHLMKKAPKCVIKLHHRYFDS